MIFACGMVLLSAEMVLAGSILSAGVSANVAPWQEVRLATHALIPGTWLVVSLCYSRGNYREFVRKWKTVVMCCFIVPVATFVVFNSSLVSTVLFSKTNHLLFIGLGAGGQLIHLYLILGSILVLMNFERTFRSAVGVMRWRIKYFVLGAALFFGATIYGSSQALLYAGIHPLSIKIEVLATLLMTLLIGYSFLRTKLGESEIYPSYEILQHSITFILAVAYLLSVGLFAKFVSDLGGSTRPSPLVSAMVAMGKALGLEIVAEGVETPDQAAQLRALGCDKAQGYLFARPLSPDAIDNHSPLSVHARPGDRPDGFPEKTGVGQTLLDTQGREDPSPGHLSANAGAD